MPLSVSFCSAVVAPTVAWSHHLFDFPLPQRKDVECQTAAMEIQQLDNTLKERSRCLVEATNGWKSEIESRRLAENLLCGVEVVLLETQEQYGRLELQVLALLPGLNAVKSPDRIIRLVNLFSWYCRDPPSYNPKTRLTVTVINHSYPLPALSDTPPPSAPSYSTLHPIQ